MICPNKICKQEISEDSFFCDQCGVRLLRCTKCGNIGTGKFCPKCGGQMVIQEPPPASNPPNPPADMPVTSAPETSVTVPNTPPAAAPSVPPVTSAPAEATVVVRLPSQGIFLCHPDGWRLEVKDGDVLGRTGGVHAALLGKFPVISSNHAKVTRRGADWYITDLKSTNKTFVNGARLEPEVPVKIKQNDVIVLANVTFTVSET